MPSNQGNQLVTCGACGHALGPLASACPGCGQPTIGATVAANNAKNLRITLVGFAFLALFLWWIFRG